MTCPDFDSKIILQAKSAMCSSLLLLFFKLADSGSGHRDEEGSIFDLRTVYTLHLKPPLGCIVLLYPKVESSYHR